MERLTAKWRDRTYDAFDPVDIVDNEYSKINYEKLLVKLGEYEDAEEQGLLFKLPVSIGSTVYIIARRKVIPLEVDAVCINSTGTYIAGRNVEYGYGKVTLDLKKLSDEWFLSKEDAEKLLKQSAEILM